MQSSFETFLLQKDLSNEHLSMERTYVGRAQRRRHGPTNSGSLSASRSAAQPVLEQHTTGDSHRTTCQRLSTLAENRETRNELPREHRHRRLAPPVFEFLRRFLLHVLPRGLHKSRHYGFLSRRSKKEPDDVRPAVLKTLTVIESDPELET